MRYFVFVYYWKILIKILKFVASKQKNLKSSTGGALSSVCLLSLRAQTGKSNLTFKSRKNKENVLTLAILAVLVASSDRVHTVAGGAVGWRAVRLGGSQAVHALDGVRALAAAGWDGVGALKTAVKRRDGEVVLGLWGYSAGVTQDAHHLEWGKRAQEDIESWTNWGSKEFSNIYIFYSASIAPPFP